MNAGFNFCGVFYDTIYGLCLLQRGTSCANMKQELVLSVTITSCPYCSTALSNLSIPPPFNSCSHHLGKRDRLGPVVQARYDVARMHCRDHHVPGFLNVAFEHEDASR